MMPPPPHSLTKRGILGVISRIYDLLGLMAPAVAELKFYFLRLVQEQIFLGQPTNWWDKGLIFQMVVRFERHFLY